MKQQLLLITLLALLPVCSWGQTTRVDLQHADTVSQKIVLPPDRKGREPEVELRMCFNEQNNTVWVSLSSARYIFGLQNTTRYEEVFTKGYFCHFGGKFKTINLPYEVNMNPKEKPRMKKSVRKEIGKYKKPRYKHFLRPWVSSSDMTTTEVPCEMLTNQLSRTFKVHAGEDSVHIQLRDLFLLDHKGMSSRAFKRYVINQHVDQNTEYVLQLHRSPCFGKEAEIEARQARLLELRQAHAQLLASFPAGTKITPEEYNAFYVQRDSLLREYPLKKLDEECADLLALDTDYNHCVDSIFALQRYVKQNEAQGELIATLEKAKELDALNLMYKARQLDELTALWLVTPTHSERLNIRQQCGRVMREAEKLKDGRKVINDDQRKALETYNKALKYYTETVR